MEHYRCLPVLVYTFCNMVRKKRNKTNHGSLLSWIYGLQLHMGTDCNSRYDRQEQDRMVTYTAYQNDKYERIKRRIKGLIYLKICNFADFLFFVKKTSSTFLDDVFIFNPLIPYQSPQQQPFLLPLQG